MKKIANIFPIANQKFYKNETYIMILAHLLKDGLYNTKYFNKEGQYVILDNGLFENSQVSNDLETYIQLAETCGIKVNEIVIPDAMFNYKETIQLFEKNLETIKKWQHKYKFMFVAQAQNYEEFKNIIEYINKQNYNLSIGIPKKCIIARDSAAAIELYKKCVHPIHLLGVKSSFAEILPAYKYIRGCDTSQLAFIAKNVDSDNLNDIDVVNYVRDGIDIDLRNDKVNNYDLEKLLNMEKEGFNYYGIL